MIRWFFGAALALSLSLASTSGVVDRFAQADLCTDIALELYLLHDKTVQLWRDNLDLADRFQGVQLAER